MKHISVQKFGMENVLDTEKPLISIFYVGSSAKFSDQYINILESLISDLRVFRLSDFESLESVTNSIGAATLVMLDEKWVDDLLNDPSVLERFSNSCVAIAYSQKDLVSQLFACREASPHTARLSFFPLSSQFEAGLAILRLMLCEQQYLPAELVELKAPSLPFDVSFDVAKSTLTRREWEILSLVSSGRQNKIIAHELELSEHTVKLHLHHVLSKLKVKNRTEASAWFHANGASV